MTALPTHSRRPLMAASRLHHSTRRGTGGGHLLPRLLANWIAPAPWRRWGTDARLSRWSAPRTNDLDSLLGTPEADSLGRS
jgi:hypothetical protein